jgi:hypothetical protein
MRRRLKLFAENVMLRQRLIRRDVAVRALVKVVVRGMSSYRLLRESLPEANRDQLDYFFKDFARLAQGALLCAELSGALRDIDKSSKL